MIPRCEFLHNLPCEQVSDRITELEEENTELKEQIRWLKKGDVLHVLTDQELADQQRHEREMQASITALDDENAKLRDAMYSNAKRHGLQHMDADELRIWATRQAEHIEELRDLVEQYHSAMRCTLETGTWPTDPAYLEERMRELGIEVAE